MRADAASAATLLGGRVAYTQPVDGYRTGIEPVLLAASIPARSGEWVIEAGTGAGAGLLCLAARVAGLHGTGLELDPAMAAAASANIGVNGHSDLRILVQDVATWRHEARFDHAFANPPWHSAAGTQTPSAPRRRAKFGGPELLAGWVASLAACLRPRGTLSLILPAASLATAVTALARADCQEASIYPLWPHAGQAAKLVILRALRGGRGPCRMLPGLVLHEQNGAYTPPARQILWGGGALAM